MKPSMMKKIAIAGVIALALSVCTAVAAQYLTIKILTYYSNHQVSVSYTPEDAHKFANSKFADPN